MKELIVDEATFEQICNGVAVSGLNKNGKKDIDPSLERELVEKELKQNYLK